MPGEARRYLSYLVRLWDEGGTGTAGWRASLEVPGSGARLGFADLASLFAFLEAQTETDTARDTPKEVPDHEP